MLTIGISSRHFVIASSESLDENTIGGDIAAAYAPPPLSMLFEIAVPEMQQEQQESFMPMPAAAINKRTMRNALIRFRRRAARSLRSSSSTMRNALVRFGKRSPHVSFPPLYPSAAPALIGIDDLFNEFAQQRELQQKQRLGMMGGNSNKRNSAPQPFVRFGRSLGRAAHHAAGWGPTEEQQLDLLVPGAAADIRLTD